MPADPAAADSAGDLQLAMQLQQQEDEEHQQRMAAQRQQPGQQPGQAPAQAAQAGPLGVPHTSSRGPRHGPGQSHGHHRCAPVSRIMQQIDTCSTLCSQASSHFL